MRPDLEQLLESSYRTVVGRDLRTDTGGAADARKEADPVFCHANHTAHTDDYQGKSAPYPMRLQ
jgi:hypothetical protein